MQDRPQIGSTRPGGLWPHAAVLAALNLVLYAPVLDNGFSLDDFNWLARAEFASSWWRFVFDVEPGQILNPVPRALFLLVVQASGSGPFPVHLTVLVLHIVTVGLFLHLVDKVVKDRTIALLAAVFFSFQTSYDEAIFWVAAFFYPLSGALCLGALIGAERYLAGGARRPAVGTALCSVAGLLTKASCFAVLPVMLLLPGPRPRRAVLAGMLATLMVAVAAVNVAVGAGESYLITEGHYRLGFHVVGNLLHYLGWMALPFDQALGWLGLSPPWGALWKVLGAVVLGAVVVIIPRSGSRTRLFVGLLFAPLALVLPFTFEPASRYTYLPALGAAALAAGLVVMVGERAVRSRWLRTSLLVAVALLSLADTRLRDNHYEYRERLMATWVRDVVAAVPEPPRGGTIRIVDLPQLAIDPGIHLEAALRLAYRDPDLRLEVVSGDDLPPGDGPMLRYVAGRITVGEAGGASGGRLSPGEVPRDHVPEVEQIDPEQREPSRERGQGHPPAGQLPEPERDQQRRSGGQHQEVSALGLEVVPAVGDQGEQQHGVRGNGPDNCSIGAAPLRSGTVMAQEPHGEPGRGGRRKGDVDRDGLRIGQHLHPTEGAPPALEAAHEERGDPVLAKQPELGAGVVESQRAGGDRERIGPAVQRDVPGDPGSCDHHGGRPGSGGRAQPAGSGSDDPEPRAVQRNRDHGADLDQHADTHQKPDPQWARLARHGEQQRGPHQLDGRVVAQGHRHRAPHWMERDEESGGRCYPAIVGEHRTRETLGNDHHRTRQQQVEQPDGGERSGHPVEKGGDQVIERRLVRLVGDGCDARIPGGDSFEVASLQPLELGRSPCAGGHLRQAAAVGDSENGVDVGRLVRPVECGYRRQVAERECRVDENSGRQPCSVSNGAACEESLHEI
jgi:hypothetical protein